MVNIVLTCVIILIIGIPIAYIVRAKRRGVHCIGCDAGGGCNCGCHNDGCDHGDCH